MVAEAALRDHLLEHLRAASLVFSTEQVSQLVAYYALLSRWNARTNLTSLNLEDPAGAAVHRLLIEPLLAANDLPDGLGGTWFDVGSGGGSPAIPMKIARPGLQLYMTESRLKKAAFLKEAVHAADLHGVEVLADRFENLVEANGGASLVSARAVRLDARILSRVHQVLAQAGLLLYFSHWNGENPSGFRLRSYRDDGLAAYCSFQKERLFHVEHRPS